MTIRVVLLIILFSLPAATVQSVALNPNMNQNSQRVESSEEDPEELAKELNKVKKGTAITWLSILSSVGLTLLMVSLSAVLDEGLLTIMLLIFILVGAIVGVRNLFRAIRLSKRYKSLPSNEERKLMKNKVNNQIILMIPAVLFFTYFFLMLGMFLFLGF